MAQASLIQAHIEGQLLYLPSSQQEGRMFDAGQPRFSRAWAVLNKHTQYPRSCGYHRQPYL